MFLVDAALVYVYVHGPRLLGCWEGAKRATICNHLTNVEEVWDHLPEQCDELLRRKCHAYTTVLCLSASLFVAYRLLSSALSLLPSVVARQAHAEHGHRLVGASGLALVGLDPRRFALETLE